MISRNIHTKQPGEQFESPLSVYQMIHGTVLTLYQMYYMACVPTNSAVYLTVSKWIAFAVTCAG